MSKELELRCWQRLLGQGSVARSQVPSSVRKSAALEQLLAAEIVGWRRQGSGQVLRVLERDVLEQFVTQHFPEHERQPAADSFTNVRRYRNTKAAARTTTPVILLRGQGEIHLNDQYMDLGKWTARLGCVSATEAQLVAVKVCIVENLDCFLRAEQLLGREWVFVHPYGRWSTNSITQLGTDVLLHFGDYDFTGLDEYLRIKEQFPQAQLHVPADLEQLWQRFATPLKKDAIPSKRVQNTQHPQVQRIRDLIARTNCFLEQQALFPYLTDEE